LAVEEGGTTRGGGSHEADNSQPRSSSYGSKSFSKKKESGGGKNRFYHLKKKLDNQPKNKTKTKHEIAQTFGKGKKKKSYKGGKGRVTAPDELKG